MTANPETLEKIVNTIRSEVPKYLSPEFVVHDVTAENRPGPDDEDYVHIRVILEDNHPKLDTQVLIRFRTDMGDLFEQLEIPQNPNILLRQPERAERMTTPATPTPAPIEWANLIQAGRDLLSPQQAGRLPTHEHIRRAESNAYYAMFHSLAHSNATTLIGPPTNPTTTAPWSRILPRPRPHHRPTGTAEQPPGILHNGQALHRRLRRPTTAPSLGRL